MGELMTLLSGEMTRGEIGLGIEKYLTTGENYKQYTKLLKKALKDAVGANDDVRFFLYDGYRIGKGHELRIIPQERCETVLPKELEALAERWTDAYEINQECADNQYNE